MDRFSAIHQDGQRSFSPLSILTPQPSLDSSPLSQDSTPIIQNILPRYYNDTPPKNAPQGGWTPFPTDLLFTPRNLQIFEGKIEPNKSVTGNLELKGEAMRCDHSAETNLRRDRENGNNNMGSEDWNIKDFKKNQKEQQMSRGTRRQFLRTKMCPFLSKGKCSNELFCSYAHSPVGY